MSASQLGHLTRPGVTSFQLARLLSLRALDVFLFGTAITYTSYIFTKKIYVVFALLFFVLAVKKLFELVPTGIDLARSASAFVADHFLSALGAESAAIGRAEKS